MKTFLKKHTGTLFLFVLIGLSSLLLAKSFDQKVEPLGDNAHYYILGSAIAEGKGFTDLHLESAPRHNHYPPGYPAVIAALKTLGLGTVEGVKRLNQVLFVFSSLLVYFLSLRLSGSRLLAFLVALLCVTNYHLLEFSSIMMSEILFLFLSLLSIVCLLRSKWESPWFKDFWFWAMLVLLTTAFYVRTAGIVLLLSTVVWFFYQAKKKHGVALAVSFFALITPWQIRSHALGGSTYIKQLLMVNPYDPDQGSLGLSSFFTRIADNFLRYLGREVPSAMFNFFRVEDYNEAIPFWYWGVGVVILVGVINGLTTLAPRYRVLLLGYLIFSFGVLLIWPQVWEGIRFVLPLVPILLLLFLMGIYGLVKGVKIELRSKLSPLVSVGLLTLFVLAGTWGYTQTLKPLFNKAKSPEAKAMLHYYDLANWARSNTPDTSLICTRKGELFYLKAERPTVKYLFTKDHQAQIDFLKSKNVDYVVATYIGFSSTNDYLIPAIRLNPLKFETVYELINPNAYLMKFHPDRGYTGEWNGDKKEGYGVFRFLDGRVYEGQWKDDKKEGAGKIRFENGYYVSGRWTSDLLSGPMLIFNARNEQVDSVFVQSPIDPVLNFNE